MKLEDLKKEMAEAIYIDPPNQFTTSRLQYDRVTQYWLDKLDKLDLPDPDAKLRKVREEITASFSDLLKGLTAERSDQFWRNGLLTMLVKAQSIIDSHLTPSEPEVDEELEAARQKFKVGRKFTCFTREKTYTVAEVRRYCSSSGVQIVDKESGYPWEISSCKLLPLEPKWPSCVADGVWIYWNENMYWITDTKPEACKIYGHKASAKRTYYHRLRDFLAPLGLTIEDLEIPEVPVSERCWVKGGAK
jgi:hypothetical protein